MSFNQNSFANTADQSRRKFLKVASLSMMMPFIGSLAGCAKNHRPPNIIYIMADDLGYGDVGCYGQKKIKTPNIDRLAEQGTRYTQCYTASAVCAPCRNGLMIGQHMGHATIRGNHPEEGGIPTPFEEPSIRLPLNSDDVTVASILKNAGYSTGITGKWGIGEANTDATPTQKGFDEWLGFLNQDHAVYYYTDYLWHNQEKRVIPENQGGKRGTYVHDLFEEFTLDFMSKHKDQPFFFYGAYTIPHADYEVPDLGIYADEPWSEQAKIYAAMITRLDVTVGLIMDQLQKLGLEENTIVFFCSDNGANQKEPQIPFDSVGGFRGRKGTLYEGGIRTPMIVQWPGKIAANMVDDKTVWYFPDFMPTAAELAGTKSPKNIDGISVLPALRGRSQPELSERYLYWEFPKRDEYWQAIRWKNWKAVRTRFGEPFELYDLSNDVKEENNLADQHPDIVKQMTLFAKTAHVDSPHWTVK